MTSLEYQKWEVEKEELDEIHQNYVERMSKKIGPVLNQEIRKMETRDMNRRKIKNELNDDKLFDFLKIKNIKTEKMMEQQRRQQQQQQREQEGAPISSS